MVRPSLTPMTYCEFDRPKDRSWRWLLRNVLRVPWFVIRFIWRALVRIVTTDLGSARMRKTLPLRTVLIGSFMKLAWLPPAVVIACGWVVYRRIHEPTAAHTGQVARVANAFNERVSFLASDGVRLSAVWVPAVTPQDVIRHGEELLKRRHAAVVLVHDHGHDAGQMMAQASLLHEMGVHVLLLDTRGAGESEAAARTFGRLERLDVAAAVDHLASRPTVDPTRIAVWGIGSGAEAAQNAGASVPIALLLAERGADPEVPGAVDDRFMPPHPAYDPLRPVCRWVFHIFWSGGAADTGAGRPTRVVELESGDIAPALAELRKLASERLVASGQ